MPCFALRAAATALACAARSKGAPAPACCCGGCGGCGGAAAAAAPPPGAAACAAPAAGAAMPIISIVICSTVRWSYTPRSAQKLTTRSRFCCTCSAGRQQRQQRSVLGRGRIEHSSALPTCLPTNQQANITGDFRLTGIREQGCGETCSNMTHDTCTNWAEHRACPLPRLPGRPSGTPGAAWGPCAA